MTTEHKPERYSALSVARPIDETDAAIESFFRDVEAARLTHKITDVHVIARVITERDGEDAPGIATAHFGAIQEAEGMVAFAYARSAEMRRTFLDGMKVMGAKAWAKK